jgi:FAD:protein FMN transferase
MSGAGESIERFGCFGGFCEVIVAGPGARRTAAQAAGAARRLLKSWHAPFSRFQPDSELSRVNADPRHTLAVSPLMARLAGAVARAGKLSGGLVDATLADEIRAAGYEHDLGETLALERALRLAPGRAPAGPAREAGWRTIEADVAAATITRPPGVKLDGGGLAKGLFADVLAALLESHGSFAVNCAGDLALGGRAGALRPVNVQSPFDERILHTFQLASGGVATSGIGRRAWLDGDGRPAHHLLDPATGRPAFTGVVQATALAPTALEAEIRAKAAILSGRAGAARWLSGGGVVVFDDGSHEALAPGARRVGTAQDATT